MPAMELSVTSFLVMILEIAAISAETQTGPYRADQTILPFEFPSGAPHESNLEARAGVTTRAGKLWDARSDCVVAVRGG